MVICGTVICHLWCCPRGPEPEPYTSITTSQKTEQSAKQNVKAKHS